MPGPQRNICYTVKLGISFEGRLEENSTKFKKDNHLGKDNFTAVLRGFQY